LRHAEAIGIGFYDGAAFGRRSHLPQAPVIGDKRIEIDGKDCSLARLGLEA
jgi:hypothetical protein